MTQLIRLFDQLRHHGYIVRDISGNIQKLKPSLAEIELFEKVEPFVFLGNENPFDANKHVNDLAKWTPGPDVNEEIDAPFPVFSIECLEGALDFFTTQHTVKPKEGRTMCILVIEISPKEYGYYCLTDSYQDGVYLGASAWKSNVEGDTVKHYLERLSREKTGVETTRTMVKLGEGKTKRQHRIRRVVYVRPKTQSVSITDEHRQIDWSHRFEVRGHWVNLPGRLGKDRNGEYNVPGWTWRTNHIKGPKHLPLIKKTRIIDT